MHEVFIAVIAFLGTAVGSVGGILASAKLTNFRLERLEEKVEKHNKFGERIPVLEERITALTQRIDDLEARIMALSQRIDDTEKRVME